MELIMINERQSIHRNTPKGMNLESFSFITPTDALKRRNTKPPVESIAPAPIVLEEPLREDGKSFLSFLTV